MFLLLVAGDGGAAMWILILQEHPGEFLCLDFLCEAGWCLSGGVPNKSGLFPAGGMDGGVKLLFLFLLSVRLVLRSGARCSAVLVISSFADCGVVRIVFPVVGLLCRIADFLSNGGSCFRSPAFGPVAAEPLPSSTLRAVGRCSFIVQAAHGVGRWTLAGFGVEQEGCGSFGSIPPAGMLVVVLWAQSLGMLAECLPLRPPIRIFI